MARRKKEWSEKDKVPSTNPKYRYMSTRDEAVPLVYTAEVWRGNRTPGHNLLNYIQRRGKDIPKMEKGKEKVGAEEVMNQGPCRNGDEKKITDMENIQDDIARLQVIDAGSDRQRNVTKEER